MFSPDDSIVAIATPPGRGGIGVVRISGPSALDIARGVIGRREPLEPRVATFTRFENTDEVLATYFPAPRSYTGQHVVEISAHGSPVILDAIVRRAIESGARLAEPGEFTLRAFLNGKRDLIQAEAVADLIDAATPRQARVAFDQLDGTLTRRIAAVDAELFDLIARLEASLDFPDEGYHFIEPSDVVRRVDRLIDGVNELLGDARQGRMIREGATVVIAGRPNVGKSSLFNALAGHDRAIVTEIAGTTRDLITERIDLEGIPITLVDTAGWRDTTDIVEREGVARAERARGAAHLLLVVLDAGEALTHEDRQLLAATATLNRIVAANKRDLITGDTTYAADMTYDIAVSATTRESLPALRHAIVSALTGRELLRDTVAISNTRHIALLEDARACLASARDAAHANAMTEEFVLSDLQAARARFDEIVGVRTHDDLLEHIFSRFCVGK